MDELDDFRCNGCNLIHEYCNCGCESEELD